MKEKLKIWLDRILIVHFFVGAIYPAYITMFVLRPDDNSVGPLWAKAASMPFELMVKRRLYALEFWLVSFVIIVYFANRKRIYNWKD